MLCHVVQLELLLHPLLVQTAMMGAGNVARTCSIELSWQVVSHIDDLSHVLVVAVPRSIHALRN